MKKEIALYVNSLEQIADFNKSGFVRIFTKDNNSWKLKKETEFDFTQVMEKDNLGLDALKISNALEDCKVLVAKEIPNLIYMLLDNIGVSIWKMEGDQYETLEYVFEKELEEEEEIKIINNVKTDNEKESFLPKEIGSSGYYTLNLKKLQEANIGITTKRVLKPFLLENKFKELVVTCSHIPFWLESELERLNLNFEASKTGENDYILIINHNR
ncbi:Fe-only nitrogenase accessory AnfO family protein [Clostridium sp. C2-6-12]|uniref:Fe-only nitrogenase accessory AnfO family protein n=1 Tax=Clostridium sp. C2-6-12 TaxID=2698832 RepID=UPI00136E0729|nr:Fe-only nitrogenase accessory AnfO family protein [Clostridium sp. C2-6-12]